VIVVEMAKGICIHILCPYFHAMNH
jgi:hypothetical protein